MKPTPENINPDTRNPEPETRTAKPKANYRKARLILVLGRNGCGKSTFVNELVKNEEKAGGRALIVTPDTVEWLNVEWVHGRLTHHIETYKGNRKMIAYPGFLSDINRFFKSGLLVFDDCRTYFRATRNQDISELLIRRRQKELDTIVVAHGFTEIPPMFYTFATEIVLFKTAEKIERRKDVLKNFEMMKLAKEQVDAHPNEFHYMIIEQN